MMGRLFFIVGPSGAGKDTLMSGAKAADPTLHWVRRVITRPETAGGEPFEGVTATEFQSRLESGAFALHWKAHGLCYGVPFEELAPLLHGGTVMVNGSRAALAVARESYPDLRVIRVSAPSTTLADRLMARGRESRAEIEARLSRASYDLPAGLPVTDVVNDATPATGIARLLQALRA